MHPEARDGLTRQLAASGLDLSARWRVLDLGGRDINGGIRDLLPNARWSGIDIAPGPGVDLVFDCTRPWPETMTTFDLVVCTEVLEHVEKWALILRTASQALEPGGPELLFVTCASTGRPQHGASGAPLPAPGEWYGNVAPAALADVLEGLFREAVVEFRPSPGDAYARAQGVAARLRTTGAVAAVSAARNRKV
ncbi:methyltransferase domain-containing protein [Streptomyces sp. NPDC058464]|uniref:methyltransferase domain-containing protein n=1 Tax=Streptomyces sp. NPDC058464 TaxID=3346511 RepID=UPI00365BC594